MDVKKDRVYDYAMLQYVWEHSTEAFMTLRMDGRVSDANPAFTRLLGWHLDEVRDKYIPPFIADLSEKDYQVFLQALKEGHHFPNELVKRVHKDGSILTILASYQPIKQNGILAIVMYKDITEQTFLQQQFKKSEQDYRVLVENLPEAVLKLHKGEIVLLNQSGVELFAAIDRSELLGKQFWDYVDPAIREGIESLPDSGFQLAETITTELFRCDGRRVWVEMKVIALQEASNQDFQIVIRDITEKRKYESRLKFLAYHDPLTGLKNRTIFTDLVSQAIEQASQLKSRLAILYIDIDHFKEVNDTFSHQVGDALLQQFAKRLQASIRNEDVACRIGGDEFLILLKDLSSREEVASIARRILDTVQDPFKISGLKLSITVSVGISLFPQDGRIGRDLIHRADVALYEAKRERNQFCFYQAKDS